MRCLSHRFVLQPPLGPTVRIVVCTQANTHNINNPLSTFTLYRAGGLAAAAYSSRQSIVNILFVLIISEWWPKVCKLQGHVIFSRKQRVPCTCRETGLRAIFYFISENYRAATSNLSSPQCYPG